MQTTGTVNITPSSRNRYHDSKTYRLQTPPVPCTLSSPYRVFCLVFNVVGCMLLCAEIRFATAHSHRQSETVRQAASQSQPFTGESAARMAALEQHPHGHDFPSNTLHLFLEPLPVPSTMTAAVQPPAPFSFAYRRFSIFPGTHDEEDFSFFTAAGILYGPALGSADSTDPGLFAVTLRALPLLAWVNYRASEALQFHVSRSGGSPAPTPFTPTAFVPLEIIQTQLLSQPLTVAQVHGALAFGTRKHGVLQYALYAGVFAEETPRDLVAGAGIGYTDGTTGFTLSIGYLYGPHAVGLDVFGSPYAGGTAHVPGSDLGVLGMYHLADQDRLRIENRLLHGIITGASIPLAVHNRSVLSLNHHWTVYHRFDRLYLGPGLPKITEHSIGVRFRPVTNVSLQTEVIVGGVDEAMGNAGGVRFAGTIRF
jgi:hypothetical protein